MGEEYFHKIWLTNWTVWTLQLLINYLRRGRDWRMSLAGYLWDSPVLLWGSSGVLLWKLSGLCSTALSRNRCRRRRWWPSVEMKFTNIINYEIRHYPDWHFPDSSISHWIAFPTGKYADGRFPEWWDFLKGLLSRIAFAGLSHVLNYT